MKAKHSMARLFPVATVVWVVLVLVTGMISVAQAEKKVLSLNKATAAELQNIEEVSLPAALCKAIVDYRIKHGPFKDREDLNKVPGMTGAWMNQLNPTNRNGDVVYDPDAEPVMERSKC